MSVRVWVWNRKSEFEREVSEFVCTGDFHMIKRSECECEESIDRHNDLMLLHDPRHLHVRDDG